MPTAQQINDAIVWALQQTYELENEAQTSITKETPHFLVDKVREYYNSNSIEYSTFSYDDLVTFLEPL